MGTLDIAKVRQEILVFLRNSDILTITQRGVTTISDVFTATSSQTEFPLNKATARNIRLVMVDWVEQDVYEDYTPTYASGTSSTITLTTGATANSSVSILYDYSSGTIEKVWPDYPEVIYLPTSCPRIGFDIISMRTTQVGIGSTNWFTDAMVRIRAYDIGTYLNIETFLTSIRSAIKTAATDFYHFQIANVSDMSPVIPHSETSESTPKVFERYIDVIFRFGFET